MVGLTNLLELVVHSREIVPLNKKKKRKNCTKWIFLVQVLCLMVGGGSSAAG